MHKADGFHTGPTDFGRMSGVPLSQMYWFPKNNGRIYPEVLPSELAVILDWFPYNQGTFLGVNQMAVRTTISCQAT